MKLFVLAALPCLLGTPLLAQPQIGGGTCSSATLSGNYSLTITGRDLNSTVNILNALQGIGSATFDGLSKVTFTLTNNSNSQLGKAVTLSGTYSMQANCIGTINITSGDTGTFTLISYNQGTDYLITGQDGTYSYTGSGNTLPATCPTTISGVYSFNGSGFVLNSNAITAVDYLSGLFQFNGTGSVTTTWYVTGNSTPVTTTGSYTIGTGPGCTATASITDPSGNAYSLVFTLTNAGGTNFIFGASNSKMMFSGSGRTL
jgi:hypothetical protein